MAGGVVEFILKAKDEASYSVKGVEKALEGVAHTANHATGIVGGLGVAFGALVAVTGGIVGMGEKLVADVEGLLKVERATGATAEQVQTLQVAFKQMHVDATVANSALLMMARSIGRNDPLLHDLGIESRNAFDAIVELSQALQTIPDAGTRAAVMQKLLARASKEAGGAVIELASNVKSVRQQISDRNALITDETIERTERLHRASEDLALAFRGLWLSASEGALPAATRVIEALDKMIQAFTNAPKPTDSKGILYWFKVLAEQKKEIEARNIAEQSAAFERQQALDEARAAAAVRSAQRMREALDSMRTVTAAPVEGPDSSRFKARSAELEAAIDAAVAKAKAQGTSLIDARKAVIAEFERQTPQSSVPDAVLNVGAKWPGILRLLQGFIQQKRAIEEENLAATAALYAREEAQATTHATNMQKAFDAAVPKPHAQADPAPVKVPSLDPLKRFGEDARAVEDANLAGERARAAEREAHATGHAANMQRAFEAAKPKPSPQADPPPVKAPSLEPLKRHAEERRGIEADLARPRPQADPPPVKVPSLDPLKRSVEEKRGIEARDLAETGRNYKAQETLAQGHASAMQSAHEAAKPKPEPDEKPRATVGTGPKFPALWSVNPTLLRGMESLVEQKRAIEEQDTKGLRAYFAEQERLAKEHEAKVIESGKRMREAMAAGGVHADTTHAGADADTTQAGHGVKAPKGATKGGPAFKLKGTAIIGWTEDGEPIFGETENPLQKARAKRLDELKAQLRGAAGEAEKLLRIMEQAEFEAKQEKLVKDLKAAGASDLTIVRAGLNPFPDDRTQKPIPPPPKLEVGSGRMSKQEMLDALIGPEEFRKRIEDTTKSVVHMSDAMIEVGMAWGETVNSILSGAAIVDQSLSALFNGLQSGFGQVFANLTRRGQTFRSAMRTIFGSLVNEVLAMLARIAAAKVFALILKLIPGLGTVAGFALDVADDVIGGKLVANTLNPTLATYGGPIPVKPGGGGGGASITVNIMAMDNASVERALSDPRGPLRQALNDAALAGAY